MRKVASLATERSDGWCPGDIRDTVSFPQRIWVEALFMKRKMLLLVSIICTAIVSCRPLVTGTPGEKSGAQGSEGQVGLNEHTLSKEQIIAIANVEARRHGWNPERWVTIYDRENAEWESVLSLFRAPPPPIKPVPPPAQLEGRDYQVVIYRRQDVALSGDLFILVDRNTGEVLYVLHGA
jgi:hypothetical protein